MILSIVIPVKNMEKYIEKCIKSILNQKKLNYKKIEIIVCDFGSNDNTLNIIKKLNKKNEYNIYIYDKNITDVVEARNLGLSCAIGKYISFLDADDWIDVNYYSKILNVMENNNLDICYSDYINKNELSKVEKLVCTKKIELLEKLSNISKFIINNDINCEAWNKVYRTAFLKENNLLFNNKYGVNGEDLLFNLYMLKFAPKIYFVDNVFYFHLVRRKSLGSINSSNISKRFTYIINTLEKEKIEGVNNYYILFINLMLQDLNRCSNLREFKQHKMVYKEYKNYYNALVYNIFSVETNIKRKLASLLLIANCNFVIFYIRKRRNK